MAIVEMYTFVVNSLTICVCVFVYLACKCTTRDGAGELFLWSFLIFLPYENWELVYLFFEFTKVIELYRTLACSIHQIRVQLRSVNSNTIIDFMARGITT
jgi:hypothetical protein